MTSTIIEPPIGLEPITSCLQNMRSTIKAKEALSFSPSALITALLPGYFTERHNHEGGYFHLQPQIVLAVNTDRSIPVFTETICDLGGTRTHGSYIKSVILYQLSYEVILRKANNKSLLILLSWFFIY